MIARVRPATRVVVAYLVAGLAAVVALFGWRGGHADVPFTTWPEYLLLVPVAPLVIVGRLTPPVQMRDAIGAGVCVLTLGLVWLFTGRVSKGGRKRGGAMVASIVGVISRCIATTYVAVGLVLQVLGDALGAQYDDRGIRGALNVVSLSFSAVTWGIGEIVLALNGGRSAPGQRLWVPAASLGLAVVLDLGISTLRRRMRGPDR